VPELRTLTRAAIRTIACAFLVSTAFALDLAQPRPAAAVPAEFDAAAEAVPTAEAQAARGRLENDPALRRLAHVQHVDAARGVPSFVWASRRAGVAARAAARGTPEQAARGHLKSLAALYRLEARDADEAPLRFVHDTGRGGVVVALRQSVDGIPVFRDEVRVLMDRNLELVAVAGAIPSRGTAPRSERRAWIVSPEQARNLALSDLAPASEAPGGPVPTQPVRVEKRWFRIGDALQPAYYVELEADQEAMSYVVSATDGAVLYRHNLVADAAFTYRVWADNTPLQAPMDGPQGNAPTPHPTGLPDFYVAPWVASSLHTLQNGPISTNDPWLAAGATTTQGNNVDAYADLGSPDGFTGADLRPSTTSPGTFDRTYDPTLPPSSSTNQRLASVTQLFYLTNWLHDWYYDSGFDEQSGNAQLNNYGRGGLQNDRMRAEDQDYSGTNNANMNTPSDGASPRMQMYVWNSNPAGKVTILGPASVAGVKSTNNALFGPSTFDVTGEVVVAVDGTAPTSDACSPLTNAVAGKIVLIDRGLCTYPEKVLAAQNAGAIGVIVAHDVAGQAAPQMTGTPSGTVTIAALSVTKDTGDALKAAIAGGTVTARLQFGPQTSRDSGLDGQVVAHEWGHYISNRLIGDANGLTTQQSAGMGEGWGDFHALLLTVKPEDALLPVNPGYAGAYPVGGYSLNQNVGASNAYYFGVRRYPYSTDFNKNPLTFRHVQNGVPLPVGPPVAFGQDGANNASVHATGTVWCTMLWECYAELLRATSRLTFEQARDRMKDYIVAAYKMTPNAPTILEARDALLAVALANDPLDFTAFWQAFARRGAGVGAIGPPRYALDNVGVTESFAVGGDLQFVSFELDDSAQSCDGDGLLDQGETGQLVITLRNAGATTLAATTASVTSANPAVTFVGGNSVAFPASPPFGEVSATVVVHLNAAAGVQTPDFQIEFDDPGLAVDGPRSVTVTQYANADLVPSTLETVEAPEPAWSFVNLLANGAEEPWRRLEVSPTQHRFYVPDAGGVADQVLVSPPIQVANTGSFSFTFQHAFRFESSSGVHYDGGVIEISTNGGGSWTDIGASASPGYGGTLFTGSGNPLSGRSAFVQTSPGYPALSTVTVNLGTAYQGQTVRLRFRIGSDQAANDFGWTIDDLQLVNASNAPFEGLVAEASACEPVAVGDTPPTEWSFALAGANPIVGNAAFQFALPAAAHVTLALYDVAGRRVAKLAEGDFPAGVHTATWSRTEAPRAGVYFARLVAGDRAFVERVVVAP
jgi:hypothetical protein